MSNLRHSRYHLLDGVGNEGLAQQFQTQVVLIGCGGVGQAVAGSLGAATIETLYLVDPENISPTNIARLPLMTENDIGKSKIQSLAEKIIQNNPNQKIELSKHPVTSDNIQTLCAGTNIIIDASDNWPTRKLLAQYCRHNNIPLISGGALATDGWVGVFMPDSPPLESWLGQPQQLADSCEQVGVLGPLVGVVGNLMAMETLKLIWKKAHPDKWQTLQGHILYIDGRYGDIRLQPLG